MEPTPGTDGTQTRRAGLRSTGAASTVLSATGLVELAVGTRLILADPGVIGPARPATALGVVLVIAGLLQPIVAVGVLCGSACAVLAGIVLASAAMAVAASFVTIEPAAALAAGCCCAIVLAALLVDNQRAAPGVTAGRRAGAPGLPRGAPPRVVARRGDTPPFGHRAVSLSRTVRPVAPIRASRPARGSPSGSRGSP